MEQVCGHDNWNEYDYTDDAEDTTFWKQKITFRFNYLVDYYFTNY